MSDNKPPRQTRTRSRRPRKASSKLEITATTHAYRNILGGKLILLSEVREKPPPIPRDKIPGFEQVPVHPGPVLEERVRIDCGEDDDDGYDDDSWAAIKRRKESPILEHDRSYLLLAAIPSKTGLNYHPQSPKADSRFLSDNDRFDAAIKIPTILRYDQQPSPGSVVGGRGCF